jgi:hypothetical protein
MTEAFHRVERLVSLSGGGIFPVLTQRQTERTEIDKNDATSFAVNSCSIKGW